MKKYGIQKASLFVLDSITVGFNFGFSSQAKKIFQYCSIQYTDVIHVQGKTQKQPVDSICKEMPPAGAFPDF